MKVVICDPHPILADALTLVLRRVDPGLTIKAMSSRQVNQLLAEDTPDLLIVDPSTDLCSPAYTKVLVSSGVKVVLFYDDQGSTVGHFDESFHRLNKNTPVRALELFFKELIKPSVSTATDHVPNKPLKLSKRMKQLVILLDKGLSNREIAKELGIAEHTVKVHLWRFYRRIQVNSRTSALAFARNNGWL